MTPEDGATGPAVSEGAVVDALAMLREHGEQVRQQELETALRKLDGLDDDQQAAIETLSERLVDTVLEPPTYSLLTAAVEVDDEVVATALSLFDDEPAPDRDTAGPTRPRTRLRSRSGLTTSSRP